MARLVRHDQTGPYRYEKAQLDGDTIFICGCGLSKEYPFCDGTHKQCRGVEEEGKLYVWENDIPRAVQAP